MIHLLDGPAAKTRLTLARAPWLLRVVIDPAGKIDALDQLRDSPRPDEQIHVYRIQGKAGIAHFDRTVNGRRVGTWSAFADYRLHTEQPTDQQARDTEAWQAWATGQLESFRRTQGAKRGHQ